jgi:hypothetical protein
LYSLGMAHTLTIKQVCLLLVGGIVAAELWVMLFGLWAVFDTPLLKLCFRAGLSASVAASISLTLFASASAVVFTVLLRLFFHRGFLMAAALFITAFLACFVVSAAFTDEPLSLLASLSNVWVFSLLFGVCVGFTKVTSHA